MKLKQSFLYHLHEHKRPVAVFYLVTLIVFPLLFTSAIVSYNDDPLMISTEIVAEDGTVTFEERVMTPEELEESGWQAHEMMIGGMDAASMIFLFVTGTVVFFEQFKMLTQNGVSRKTMFFGRVATVATVALGMAVIDKALLILFKWVAAKQGGKMVCTSVFEQLYSARAHELGEKVTHVYSFVFCLLAYLAAQMLGYFISLMFYRLGKAGRVAVSTGVPALLFIVLPVVNFYVLNNRLSTWVKQVTDSMFGFTAQLPSHAFVTLTAVFAAFSGLCWLLSRRAVVK